MFFNTQLKYFLLTKELKKLEQNTFLKKYKMKKIVKNEVAGRKGFEPLEACTSTVFKTAAFDHSAISRKIIKQAIKDFFAKALLEVILGFEPRIKALQAHALPLGYITLWCPEPDLNRHGKNYRGILSPLRLPFPPSGQNM